MFFLLSKLLNYLISPLFWVFLFFLFFLFFKKTSRKKIYLIISISVLYFFTNSFILDEFMRLWEYKALNTNEIKTPYEYGIVLGGMSSYDKVLARVNFSHGADRLLQAVQLLHQKKIKKILISGGVASFSGKGSKEAEYLKQYLVSIGIADSLVVVEANSRNTHENAKNTSALLKKENNTENCLLITSSFHMARAVGCFKKEGIKVIPYPVERYAGPRKFQFDHCFIPSAETLRKWEYLLHEIAGYFTYKIKGYL